MKKSIGDTPAFACEADGGCGPWPGMTYRQWLLGQALAGNLAYPGTSVEGAVDASFSAADLVIETLDSEKEDSGSKETHDQSEPENERKPLQWTDGDRVYAVIRDSDNGCLSLCTSLKNAKKNAAGHEYPTSIVRVMEPTANVCPTERIAPNGSEWGVMSIDPDGWMRWSCGTKGWIYCATSESILRFPSEGSAALHIVEYKIIDAQPWPIPPKDGGAS